MTNRLAEQDEAVRELTAAGLGARAIQRELGIGAASVYRVWRTDAGQPWRPRAPQSPPTACYECDGCGAEEQASPGKGSVTCARCGGLAWEPLSDAEFRRLLAAAVARLEREEKKT